MATESETRTKMIDALYDNLAISDEFDDLPVMSREEFHIEYKEYGLIVAIYNMGYLDGQQ